MTQQSSMDIVGIDLGTTNSVVSWTDQSGRTEVLAGTDGVRILPSVVYFEPGGNVVVGDRATQFAVIEPTRAARLFKRGMGTPTFLPGGRTFDVDGKTWSPEALSSLVLAKLMSNASSHLHREVRRAVITVPAYFGEPERAATRMAGEIAGIEVVRILNEPTAAAIAHGFDHRGMKSRMLVFDLGGGTFDVTIMDIENDGSMNVVATGGDRQLGGSDFDSLIFDEMAEQADRTFGVDLTSDLYAFMDARNKAEEIKKDLSSMSSARRPITVGGRPMMFELSRDRFEQMIDGHIGDVRDTIMNTIENARCSANDIDQVLMVGGSSRIPIFSRILREITGREPTMSRNLDEDVSRGAAILAAKMRGDATPQSVIDVVPIPQDVASHGLGVSLMVDGHMCNTVVIPSGTPLPAFGEVEAWTLMDGQEVLKLELNEGDEFDLQYVRKLGESEGRFSRPRPIDHPIRIVMSYDADQIVNVKAFDGKTNEFVCEINLKHEALLSPQEREAARDFLKGLEFE